MRARERGANVGIAQFSGMIFFFFSRKLSCTDVLLRMASVARVDRRLRRYYLIVRLLPNVFVLACLPLGSI